MTQSRHDFIRTSAADATAAGVGKNLGIETSAYQIPSHSH